MNSIRTLLLVGVVGGLGAGCSEDSTGTSLNIVGSWHATSAVVTEVANPANTANLIALGATVQIVFNANLTYSSTFTFPGQGAQTSTGTYVLTATQLTMQDDQASGGEVITFAIAQSGGTLLLTGGTPFDFDFGAGEVASKLDVTLAR